MGYSLGGNLLLKYLGKLARVRVSRGPYRCRHRSIWQLPRQGLKRHATVAITAGYWTGSSLTGQEDRLKLTTNSGPH